MLDSTLEAAVSRLDLASLTELVTELHGLLGARRLPHLIAACELVLDELAEHNEMLREAGLLAGDAERVRRLEQRLARSVRCVHELLDAVATAAVRPQAALAGQLRRVLFPRGLQAHLAAPRRERARWNLRLTHVAAEPAWRAVRESTGLEDLLPQLEADAVSWWRALEAEPIDGEAVRLRAVEAVIGLVRRVEGEVGPVVRVGEREVA